MTNDQPNKQRKPRSKFLLEQEAKASLPEWLRKKGVIYSLTTYHVHWKTVGRIIRNRREDLGLSLRKMASLAEISPSFMSELENGKRSWPPQTLEKVHRILTSNESQEKPN